MEPIVKFLPFSRKPFSVEAVMITEANIDELGALLGEVRTGDGEKYIALDRRVVPNIRRASVGWWVTRMNDNLRCYSPKVFEDQFEADELLSQGEGYPEVNMTAYDRMDNGAVTEAQVPAGTFHAVQNPDGSWSTAVRNVFDTNG